jgi:hypothetical protein
MRSFALTAGLAIAVVVLPATLATAAQTAAGFVLDQTGLPLPGATVELLDGPRVVTHVSTDVEGKFVFDSALPGQEIAVSMSGFEPVHLPRGQALRIVLALAHAADSASVVASTFAPGSPLTPLLGNTLTATNISRLPSSRMKARESLPLLPSVVRGPDGLMQLGGARAYETPLLLDGFNISDPATGISSLNLPFEAVKGVDVLRDPMAVTYGGLLGGLVALESKPGGSHFAAGVQGFVPRPRFSTPEFGRLEGIFPRAYAAGGVPGDRFHYMVAAEYDYERIPVPGVTTGQGPDVVEESTIMFSRLDFEPNLHHHMTFEGLLFPGDTRSLGLSPLRDDSATTDLNQKDWFGALTDRFVPDAQDVITLQLGVLQHEANMQPNGAPGQTAVLSPAGWTGNWFSATNRTSGRYSASATLERTQSIGGRLHDFTVSGEIGSSRLRGRVQESSIVVNDAQGRPVRAIDFGGASTVSADDRPVGVSIRDVWQINDRLQVDGGGRVDYSRYGGASPSGRVGVRLALDEFGRTVVKTGYGTFVGTMPLAAPAFGGNPTRADRLLDPATGHVVSERMLTPAVGALRAPHATAFSVALERQLAHGLDAQVAITTRRTTRLATLEVPSFDLDATASSTAGLMTVASDGSGWYREAQFSVRRVWAHDQQLFVSYVRSSAHGELNDFETLFQSMDAPLVQHGGHSRTPGDAPNRLLAWATVNLPSRVVVSPVVEWRSGFPYSVLDEQYRYAGTPNTGRFPTFFSTDMVVYKTFTVHQRSADLGVQLFNVTDHNNPRDVYPVLGAPQFGEFTNSVGTIVRGYLLLKW